MIKINCPVCNKIINGKNHLTLIKDEAHVNYIESQIQLAFELYNEHKLIAKVLSDDRIFIKDKINYLLHQKYHEEIIKNNRIECNKNISKAMKKPGCPRNLEYNRLINDLNGIENIDYIMCQICGLKGREISAHINRIHKMNKKQYLLLYPSAKTNCEKVSNKISKHMLTNNPNDNPESISKMKETKAETKPERSRKAKLRILNGEQKVPQGNGHGNGGWREDLGHYVRSNWEANFARLLNNKGILYEFEKIMPLYDQNGELIYNYLVDFYLPLYDSYIEIKGKWEELAIEKVKLFKEQYSDKKYVIIEGPQYYKINKMFKNKISHWE